MGNPPSRALLAIAAGLAMAFPSVVEAGLGTAIMSVTASVNPSVALKYEATPTQLHVTKDDIARGYIDVPGADGSRDPEQNSRPRYHQDRLGHLCTAWLQ